MQACVLANSHLGGKMKILKYAVAAVVVILLIGALIAPIGPVPGFIIGGNATAAPALWPDTSELHEIKLKAGGFPPRVVIIWVIEHDDELWVAGGSDSGWVTRLAADGNAELRIEDNTYPVQAVAIKEPAVWQPVLAASPNTSRTIRKSSPVSQAAKTWLTRSAYFVWIAEHA